MRCHSNSLLIIWAPNSFNWAKYLIAGKHLVLFPPEERLLSSCVAVMERSLHCKLTPGLTAACHSSKLKHSSASNNPLDLRLRPHQDSGLNIQYFKEILGKVFCYFFVVKNQHLLYLNSFFLPQIVINGFV